MDLDAPDIPHIAPESLPQHVAIVMDGNGRWANQQGLHRTQGHEAGERALMETVAGAVELGIPELSLYAFSTENWRRSPAEVRFLMGFSRQTIHDDSATLNAWGVRVRWVGRAQKLWRSVLGELRAAEQLTQHNQRMTLNLCVNYGGRAEIVDAMRAIASQVQSGRLNPSRISEATVARYLYAPHMHDVDLMIRTSGERRTSNFLMWESAYAELAFSDVMWPDFTRQDLWGLCTEYIHRHRRFGGAQDAPRV
ncbi:MAG: isoprenyl transferase [Actinomycetaceae bacterium]|nr:isoprenyl transferase [Actinomycetaceae bacterium]MDY6083138.1 isoprenyl transferase [Actinomycetaceae bacterium]